MTDEKRNIALTNKQAGVSSEAGGDGQYGLRVPQVDGAVLCEGDALPHKELRGVGRGPGVGQRRGLQALELLLWVELVDGWVRRWIGEAAKMRVNCALNGECVISGVPPPPTPGELGQRPLKSGWPARPP